VDAKVVGWIDGGRGSGAIGSNITDQKMVNADGAGHGLVVVGGRNMPGDLRTVRADRLTAQVGNLSSAPGAGLRAMNLVEYVRGGLAADIGPYTGRASRLFGTDLLTATEPLALYGESLVLPRAGTPLVNWLYPFARAFLVLVLGPQGTAVHFVAPGTATFIGHLFYDRDAAGLRRCAWAAHPSEAKGRDDVRKVPTAATEAAAAAEGKATVARYGVPDEVSVSTLYFVCIPLENTDRSFLCDYRAASVDDLVPLSKGCAGGGGGGDDDDEDSDVDPWLYGDAGSGAHAVKRVRSTPPPPEALTQARVSALYAVPWDAAKFGGSALYRPGDRVVPPNYRRDTTARVVVKRVDVYTPGAADADTVTVEEIARLIVHVSRRDDARHGPTREIASTDEFSDLADPATGLPADTKTKDAHLANAAAAAGAGSYMRAGMPW
jgi:hypothetical protein